MRLQVKTYNIIKRSNTRSTKKNVPNRLVIHSTANPGSTAENEADWLNNPNNHRVGSWHYCVDAKLVTHAIPDDEEAFHASNNHINKTSISLEICESGNRAKTLQNAVMTAADLMFKFKLTKISRHDDFTSTKICPRILPRGNAWEDFKTDVLAQLKELQEPAFVELKLGSKGPRVKKLQERLNYHGFKLKVNSVFDKATEDAVILYQKNWKLGVQRPGVVGIKTWTHVTTQ